MSNFLSVVELFLVLNQCSPEVHPRTMAAIVETESSRNVYAINVNKGGKQIANPTTLEEAQKAFRELKKSGVNFDVGLAQVNSGNFDFYGITEDNAFDPCSNVKAGGDILKRNFQSASQSIADEQEALLAALSAYNTGNYKRGLSNGYVDKVIKKASQVVVPDIAVSSRNEVRHNKESSVDDSVDDSDAKVSTWNVFESSKGSKTVNVFGNKNTSPLVFKK